MVTRKPFFIIVDEASRIYDRGKEGTAGGLPTIDILTTRNRHSGVFTIAATQEITKLTDSIRACTGRKIIFKQNNPDDIKAIKGAAGLNEDQCDCLLKLDVGEAVVMDGTFGPINVRLHPFESWPPVSQLEIELSTKDVLTELKKSVVIRKRSLDITPCPEKKGTEDEELALMKRLCENPLADAQGICKANGWHRSKFSRVCDSLVFKGHTRKVKPLNFRRGGGTVLYEPTSKAREFLATKGLEYKLPAKCGLEAFYYLTKYISPYYEERDFLIRWEGRSMNSTADLLAVKDGKCIAIEFEMTDKNAHANLLRNAQAYGIDETIVVCKNEEIKAKIHRQIRGHKGSELGNFALRELKEFIC